MKGSCGPNDNQLQRKLEKTLHFNRLASTCFSPAAFKAIERVERNDGFVFLLE